MLKDAILILSCTFSVGRACEWEHKTVDKSSQSETFEQYMKTLKLVCDDASQPGSLVWKVANDTPDTVYYQVRAIYHFIEF